MLSCRRKAFTMIELVFVIAIIGILGAVAIPKISAYRDDAKAGICTSEFSTLIVEIVTNYSKFGYTSFRNLSISELTNTKTDISGTETGLSEAGPDNVVDGLTFNCEGDSMATVTFTTLADNGDYNLTITETPDSANVPAAIKAIELIHKHFKMGSDSTAVIPLSY